MEPGRDRDHVADRTRWNRDRSSSGAVSTIEWIWFAACDRALRALRRATWSSRIDSTAPFAVFAAPCSSPD
jgi:hypothetical protein